MEHVYRGSEAAQARPDIKERLSKAVVDFTNLRADSRNGTLAQVWMPETGTDGSTILSAQGLPFAVNSIGDLLAMFRCVSVRYRFSTDVQRPSLMGAIGRVFSTQEPEMSNNVQRYDKKVYARVEAAQRCNVFSTLVVPVFDLQSHHSHAPLAVFELVQNSRDVQFPSVIAMLCQCLQNVNLHTTERDVNTVSLTMQPSWNREPRWRQHRLTCDLSDTAGQQAVAAAVAPHDASALQPAAAAATPACSMSSGDTGGTSSSLEKLLMAEEEVNSMLMAHEEGDEQAQVVPRPGPCSSGRPQHNGSTEDSAGVSRMQSTVGPHPHSSRPTSFVSATTAGSQQTPPPATVTSGMAAPFLQQAGPSNALHTTHIDCGAVHRQQQQQHPSLMRGASSSAFFSGALHQPAAAIPASYGVLQCGGLQLSGSAAGSPPAVVSPVAAMSIMGGTAVSGGVGSPPVLSFMQDVAGNVGDNIPVMVVLCQPPQQQPQQQQQYQQASGQQQPQYQQQQPQAQYLQQQQQQQQYAAASVPVLVKQEPSQQAFMGVGQQAKQEAPMMQGLNDSLLAQQQSQARLQQIQHRWHPHAGAAPEQQQHSSLGPTTIAQQQQLQLAQQQQQQQRQQQQPSRTPQQMSFPQVVVSGQVPVQVHHHHHHQQQPPPQQLYMHQHASMLQKGRAQAPQQQQQHHFLQSQAQFQAQHISSGSQQQQQQQQQQQGVSLREHLLQPSLQQQQQHQGQQQPMQSEQLEQYYQQQQQLMVQQQLLQKQRQQQAQPQPPGLLFQLQQQQQHAQLQALQQQQQQQQQLSREQYEQQLQEHHLPPLKITPSGTTADAATIKRRSDEVDLSGSDDEFEEGGCTRASDESTQGGTGAASHPPHATSAGGAARSIAAGKHVTLEQLQAQFGCGLKEAAGNLGVCASTLKRICRRHGIKCWPRRQIIKLNKALNHITSVGGEPQPAQPFQQQQQQQPGGFMTSVVVGQTVTTTGCPALPLSNTTHAHVPPVKREGLTVSSGALTVSSGALPAPTAAPRLSVEAPAPSSWGRATANDGSPQFAGGAWGSYVSAPDRTSSPQSACAGGGTWSDALLGGGTAWQDVLTTNNNDASDGMQQAAGAGAWSRALSDGSPVSAAPRGARKQCGGGGGAGGGSSLAVGSADSAACNDGAGGYCHSGPLDGSSCAYRSSILAASDDLLVTLAVPGGTGGGQPAAAAACGGPAGAGGGGQDELAELDALFSGDSGSLDKLWEFLEDADGLNDDEVF